MPLTIPFQNFFSVHIIFQKYNVDFFELFNVKNLVDSFHIHNLYSRACVLNYGHLSQTGSNPSLDLCDTKKLPHLTKLQLLNS